MIEIQIRSWQMEEIAVKTPERYAWLKKYKPDLPELKEVTDEKTGEKKMKLPYCEWDFVCNEPALLPDWLNEVATVKLPRVLKLLRDSGETDIDELLKAIRANQVHLPGNQLLEICRVRVAEDCCTEELDGHLKEGWRIVAVCLQPGRRRPDYVLGTTNARAE